MDLTNCSHSLTNILFILVLYKIQLKESEAFTSLSNCLQESTFKVDIFIYDNSPSAILNIEDILHEKFNIHYFHDKTNPGVSKAYNQGFKLGQELNKQWLLLLDQDTIFPHNALLTYCKALQENHKFSLFAPILVSARGNIYSPCNYFLKRGFPIQSIKVGPLRLINKSLLNSGLLINIELFEQVGGYNERLKLDFSDFDFIDRCQKIIDSVFIINTRCIHTLSSHEESLNAALNNFTRYCKGLTVYIQVNFDGFCLFCITLIRACKLSLKFRSMDFIKVFFKILI